MVLCTGVVYGRRHSYCPAVYIGISVVPLFMQELESTWYYCVLNGNLYDTPIMSESVWRLGGGPVSDTPPPPVGRVQVE